MLTSSGPTTDFALPFDVASQSECIESAFKTVKATVRLQVAATRLNHLLGASIRC